MHASPRTRRACLLEGIEVVVVAKDHLIGVVAVILGEGAELAQVGKGSGHRGVLVLERELTLVGVGRDHRLGRVAAVRALEALELGAGGGLLVGHLATDGLAHLVDPLGHVDLARRLVGLGLGHVADDGELLGAGREDHLADVARAALAVLSLGVGVGIHRVHRREQQRLVTVWRLDGRAEEVEAAHVGGALDLDALLAALLDDRLEKLLRRLLVRRLILLRLLLLGRRRLLLLGGLGLLLLLGLRGLLRLQLLNLLGRRLALLLLLLLALLGRIRRRRRRLGCRRRAAIAHLERRRAEDIEELWLFDTRLEPAHDARVRLQESSIEDKLERVEEGARDNDVGGGDGIARKERVCLQVAIEHLEGTRHVLLGLGFVARVRVDEAEQRVDPHADG
mmetsp:Transcript_28384/g.72698  ORF Transcript_28384/g.72698 Transcript_28384/m.72698 type:complete len:394 (+) Transcript_28384:404-1585(+)